ncbi:hypothetical protein Gotur_027293, partial [Gossypium turneri]
RLLLLKDLSISGLDQVHKIGAELFGENQSNAFASLESLCFDNMLNWEEWDLCEDDEQVSKFRSLRKLSIERCPVLLGRLPTILQSLQTLKIYECKRLVASISSFPLLRKIWVEGCEELVDEGSLSVQKVTSLKDVSVSNISKFNISAERIMLRFANSETFCISGWKELGSLSQIGIGNCVNLQYLVDEKENNNKSMSSNTCLLERLEIGSCPSLIWLSSRGDICNRLQHLEIIDCSKLSSLFLNAKLPVMLKQLFISDCPVLECIAQDFLETIDLESIDICGAGKFKSLPRRLDKLSYLQEIRLSGFPNMVSFEESGLPTTNLRVLLIEDCENFGVLPKCINNFTSLRELSMWECSADISFPEEGFPTNLTSLQISNAPKIYTSLVEWGFNRLTSLQRLNISGEGCSRVVSFPEEAI